MPEYVFFLFTYDYMKQTTFLQALLDNLVVENQQMKTEVETKEAEVHELRYVLKMMLK